LGLLYADVADEWEMERSEQHADISKGGIWAMLLLCPMGAIWADGRVDVSEFPRLLVYLPHHPGNSDIT